VTIDTGVRCASDSRAYAYSESMTVPTIVPDNGNELAYMHGEVCPPGQRLCGYTCTVRNSAFCMCAFRDHAQQTMGGWRWCENITWRWVLIRGGSQTDSKSTADSLQLEPHRWGTFGPTRLVGPATCGNPLVDGQSSECAHGCTRIEEQIEWRRRSLEKTPEREGKPTSVDSIQRCPSSPENDR
jgi:hypothetical protein